MGFNFGNAYAAGVTGAAAGMSAGPWGALAGGVAGLIGGGLSGGSGSSTSAVDLNIKDLYNLEMYNTMKDIYFMNLQDSMNRGTMRYQTDLQRELQEQQFGHNKWFVQNAYQNTVNDLRKAGLNPILATGNGANSGSVSGGSASALGVQQGSHGIDPASLLSASANSAQAKVAKGQLALNTVNSVSDIAMKSANSSLMSEQARTEANKRQNYDADTLLKSFQSVRQNIENSNLDEKMKSEITKNIATAESSMLMARYYDFIKDFQAYNYVHSARAQEVSAGAQVKGSEAQYITATQGNAEKAIIDMMMGAFGVDNPKDLGIALNKLVRDYKNPRPGKLQFGTGWMK